MEGLYRLWVCDVIPAECEAQRISSGKPAGWRESAGFGSAASPKGNCSRPVPAVTKRPWLRTVLALVCLAWLFTSLSCRGQSVTGRISGTVTDASGAVVPGAAVTATNTSTGVVGSTTTDSAGYYSFLSLPAGTYNLSAVHSGFDTTTLSGVTLRVYQQITESIVLKVGTAKQTVTVEATPTLVETTNASLGTTVGQKTILDMPLDLREVGQLALLVPGTVDATGISLATGPGNGSGFNDFGFSGSGGSSGGNILLIDGMISRALNNSSFALDPPPEMVKEFKIQNNIYDASFGLASGTTMNLITQSGTSAIHGSAYEFVRNQALDAVPFGAISKPALSRNQFGGVVGGPIVKDKIFYFGGYEGLRLNAGEISPSVVPTAAQRVGNFSSFLTGTTANLCASSGTAAPPSLNFDTGQLFDPATEYNYTCPVDPANPGAATTTILVGTPIPGNIIKTLDPVAQKVLALFPQPNTPGIPNYTNESPQTQQNDQFDARVDATLSQSNTIFVRYLLGNSNILFPQALPAFNQYQHFRGQNLVGGWTHVLGPSTINDVRIGYQKDYLSYSCQGCPRPPGTIASFGIANLSAPNPGFELYPDITFQNYPSWGDGFGVPGYFPDVVPDSIEQYEDTFTTVKGRHTLAFGGNFSFWQTKGLSDPYQVNGGFQFNGQYSSLAGEIPNASTISDLADLELGYPAYAEYTKNAFVTNLVGGNWIALFAQDQFRVTPRFTIQAGLRWEYNRQPMDTHNQLAAFFPLSKSFTPGDALLLTALPDTQNDALCSDPYYISATGQCLVMTSAERRAHGLTGNKVRQVSYGPGPGFFAPRLGISWQPTNSDKLVVHAGAGLFSNLSDTNRLGSFVNNNPVSTKTPTYQTAFGSPPPLTNGVPTTTRNVFLNAPSASLTDISAQYMPTPFYRTPQIYEWSLSLQSQLAKTWGTEIAYVANRGIHEDYEHQYGNQPVPGVGDLQPRRPFPDFGPLNYDDYQGYSSYESVYGKLDKALSHNFQALISFTFSKYLDLEGGNVGDQTRPQDDNNPKVDYGLADENVSKTFVASPIYQLPVGRGQRFLGNSGRLVNALTGGWEVSAIVTAHSGLPFTVTSSLDYSNTNSYSPRPDRVCNGTGPKTINEWFNLNCFTTAALAQALANGTPRFGTSRRNILIAPGAQNWDFAFIKRTPITGRVTAEIRGELFNAFNHTNLGPPGEVIGTSTAGIISFGSGGRDIQLAAKVEF
jgi:Carboxypeptidase regulatory-like domain